MTKCLCSELTVELLRSTGFQDPVLVSAKASLARTREVRMAALKTVPTTAMPRHRGFCRSQSYNQAPCTGPHLEKPTELPSSSI